MLSLSPPVFDNTPGGFPCPALSCCSNGANGISSRARSPVRGPAHGGTAVGLPAPPHLCAGRLEGDHGTPKAFGFRGDDHRDRQPTDPFFYPTTMNPLFTHAAMKPLSETVPVSLVNPITELPERLQMLQQNDSLARQVQALEAAKSLAAVQTAQGLQRLRARQEQMRRMAEQDTGIDAGRDSAFAERERPRHRAAASNTDNTERVDRTDRSGSRRRQRGNNVEQQQQPQLQQPPMQQHAMQQAAANSASSSQTHLASLPPGEHSEELLAELEECLDTVRWCAESLTRESFQELLKPAYKPVSIVKDVLETVALMIGQPEARWERLRRLISGQSFLERVKALHFQQSITRDQFQQLCEHLENPEFDEEFIKTLCVPVVPLAMWCRAIGVYLSKTKFRGGGEVRPVAGAGAAIAPPRPPPEMRATPGELLVFEPDLSTMSPDDLRCVPDLTISREQVGEITFHGVTDCSELDFERIVRLEVGEVLVYPDPSLKPPVGVALNKAATVTMYQCWPPNGSKLLNDPKSQDRYRRKIKQMTEEKRARFIDYDCMTGIWKFAVDHF